MTTPEEARGPRIALAGTLDLPCPAALLSARIHERELTARLPDASFTRWALTSPAPPHPLVAPTPPLALAELTGPARDGADLVIVLGGWPGRDLLLAGDHSALTTAGPLGHEDEEVLLDCFERSLELSVRDAVSAARISALGPLDRVSIVPDPALLASRVFPVEVLERRVSHLRLLGRIPEGPFELAELGLADCEGAVVLPSLETGEGAEGLTLEDLVALVFAATSVLASSVAAVAVAASFETPAVLVAGDSTESAAAARELGSPHAETVAKARELLSRTSGRRGRAAERRLDSHFDRLAERARTAAGGSAFRERRADERASRYEKAWGAARERLLAERRLFLTRTPPAHRDTERLALLHAVESQQASLTVLQGQLLDVRTKLGAAEIEREAAQREAALLRAQVREGERLAAERPHLAAERLHLTAQLETLSRENEMLVNELARESSSARDSVELLRIAELRIVRTEADSLAAFRKADELSARLAEQTERQRAELAGLAAARTAEATALRAERDRLAGELSAMTAEFVRFQNLSVFRLTAPLRAVYKALRRAVGLSS